MTIKNKETGEVLELPHAFTTGTGYSERHGSIYADGLKIMEKVESMVGGTHTWLTDDVTDQYEKVQR